jgi:hypothetical protein
MIKEYRSTSRRNFFRTFFSETIATVEEIRGIPQCSLAELSTLSEDTWRKTVPLAANPGVYRVAGECLLRTDGKQRTGDLVRRFHEIEDRALQLFDGHHSLSQVAEELTYHYLLDPEEAFQSVKSLFNEMAGYRVYLPESPSETCGEDRASPPA